MRHDLDDVLDQAAAWHASGLGVAIATVVRTWGSSPRPAGSKLAVNERGAFVGSVSGGCIEAAVIGAAQEIMQGAPARVLDFGVVDEVAWSVGLACGGHVEVYVDRVHPEILEAIRAARAAQRTVALVTWLADGRQQLTGAEGPLAAVIARALASDRAELTDSGVLVEPLNPPLRLIAVGAVHIASPLAEIARIAGFSVTIVEPRRSWATDERFPNETLVRAWPDEALHELALDARTAVVTLTHDPKLDDPALITALASPAFYIGCLGSQKTHAARVERLADAGVSRESLARLHGPIGLPIRARSPAEIAVSIVAEIIADLRKLA